MFCPFRGFQAKYLSGRGELAPPRDGGDEAAALGPLQEGRNEAGVSRLSGLASLHVVQLGQAGQAARTSLDRKSIYLFFSRIIYFSFFY